MQLTKEVCRQPQRYGNQQHGAGGKAPTLQGWKRTNEPGKQRKRASVDTQFRTVRVFAGVVPCLEMCSCAKLRRGWCCATKAIALNALGVSFLLFPKPFAAMHGVGICEIFSPGWRYQEQLALPEFPFNFVQMPLRWIARPRGEVPQGV